MSVIPELAMNTLAITATRATPEILCNPATGVVSMQGDSYPENSFEFFNDVIGWVEQYLQQSTRPLRLELRLIYMNTSSVKAMMDIFDLLECWRSAAGARCGYSGSTIRRTNGWWSWRRSSGKTAASPLMCCPMTEIPGDDELDRLLDAAEHRDNPLRPLLAALVERDREQRARLERLLRISDCSYGMALSQTQSLLQQYDRQLRRLEKITRISDRYQRNLLELNDRLRQAAPPGNCTGCPPRVISSCGSPWPGWGRVAPFPSFPASIAP